MKNMKYTREDGSEIIVSSVGTNLNFVPYGMTLSDAEVVDDKEVRKLEKKIEVEQAEYVDPREARIAHLESKLLNLQEKVDKANKQADIST